MQDVLRSPGQPLDPVTRRLFEPRLGNARLGPSGGSQPGGFSVSRPQDPWEQEADGAAGSLAGSTPHAGRGHSLERVRIHADGAAAESAQALGANAYTVGDHIVFGAGRYNPASEAGGRLLAHELIHTVQQERSGPRIDRQCNPAMAGRPWSDRVNDAQGMGAGTARDECVKDLLDEALPATVTVHRTTTTEPSLAAAIAAGRYQEWGTLADTQVNYDRNLNAKAGVGATQFGETRFVAPASGDSIRIFIVLGPRALDPVGPEHTEMAFHHESEHAWDFLSQFALVGAGPPHGATPAEELEIYAEGFSRFFLDLWTIDNTAGTFRISQTFSALFPNYAAAPAADQDSAFESIKMFHEVRIQGIPCNEMKFRIWLQMMQNLQPASDALVNRINGLPGLGLTKGDPPADHMNTALACT